MPLPTTRYTDKRLGLRVNVENSFTQSSKPIVIIIMILIIIYRRKERE